MSELIFPLDITPEDSVVPVYLVPLTEEEETERESSYQEFLQIEQARVDREAAKQSALVKLAALGLTEEEARAVIGL